MTRRNPAVLLRYLLLHLDPFFNLTESRRFLGEVYTDASGAISNEVKNMGPIFKFWIFQNFISELEGDSGTFLFLRAIQSLLSVRDIERKERPDMRDNRMLIRADAKAQGMVTSNSVRVSERWKGSGTKSGECVSILPDGSRVPFHVTRTRNAQTQTRKRINTAHEIQRARLLGIVGTIRMGEQD